MMKNKLIFLWLVVLIFACGCINMENNVENSTHSVIPESNAENSTHSVTPESNTEDTSNSESNRRSINWDEIVDEEVTIENFADKYYRAMIEETAVGSWTQEDIIFFLEKYIQQDIEKNGSQSKYYFVKNRKVAFLYSVNTSTGMDSVHYLIDKKGESRDFPRFSFVSVCMFLTYDGDDYENIDTYSFEVFEEDDIRFYDTDDFIKFINDEFIRFVFFERGWLEIK